MEGRELSLGTRRAFSSRGPAAVVASFVGSQCCFGQRASWRGRRRVKLGWAAGVHTLWSRALGAAETRSTFVLSHQLPGFSPGPWTQATAALVQSGLSWCSSERSVTLREEVIGHLSSTPTAGLASGVCRLASRRGLQASQGALSCGVPFPPPLSQDPYPGLNAWGGWDAGSHPPGAGR